MRKTPNTTKIGLFTIGGILLFIAIFFVSVGDKLFVKKSNLVVFYFEESVKGLSVGSSVVFNGVNVGKVVKISLDMGSQTADFKIPVVAQLDKFYHKKNFPYKTNDEILRYFIKKGLRAKLTSQNMLTGQLIIDLEFKPDDPAIFRGKGIKPHYQEIPTVLSELKALAKDISNIPLTQIMNDIATLVNSLNKDAPVIMSQLRKFTMELNNPNVVISSGDSLVTNMNSTIISVGKAARAIQNFADYIERNPQAFITGKGQY